MSRSTSRIRELHALTAAEARPGPDCSDADEHDPVSLARTPSRREGRATAQRGHASSRGHHRAHSSRRRRPPPPPRTARHGLSRRSHGVVAAAPEAAHTSRPRASSRGTSRRGLRTCAEGARAGAAEETRRGDVHDREAVEPAPSPHGLADRPTPAVLVRDVQAQERRLRPPAPPSAGSSRSSTPGR